MAVDQANSQELAAMAGEVGADILHGVLRYPSESGGWQLGDLDLSEYLARFRNQRLVLIIAPLCAAEPETYTCGICGFVMNEVGECPRCKLIVQARQTGWWIPASVAACVTSLKIYWQDLTSELRGVS